MGFSAILNFNEMKHYTLDDCSPGKHLFSRDKVERNFSLDSRETKQMFSEGAVINCFVI